MTVQVGVVQMGPWVEGTLFVGKLAMHHEAEHSDFFMALTVNLKVIFYVFLKHTKNTQDNFYNGQRYFYIEDTIIVYYAMGFCLLLILG